MIVLSTTNLKLTSFSFSFLTNSTKWNWKYVGEIEHGNLDKKNVYFFFILWYFSLNNLKKIIIINDIYKNFIHVF
jgi:hypothetical protein